MANISKRPDFYIRLINGYKELYTSSPIEMNLFRGTSGNYEAGYLADIPSGATVTACSIEVYLEFGSLVTPFSLKCSLYEDQYPEEARATPIAATTAQFSQDETIVTKKFSFSGLNMNADYLSFGIGYTANNWGTTVSSAVTVSLTYTIPSLTVGVTPSSLKAGESVALSYGNRLDQTLNVQLKYNSTVLSSFATADDTDTLATSFDWFKTSGVTGNSMKVDVSVSDGLGRTGSASFTLTRDALGVGVTPSSVAVGGSVTLDFTNRLSQTLTVNLRYGSTQLIPAFNVSADTRAVNTSTDWFTTAGVTGNSMRVDVSVSDGTGRTASTSFTVTRSGLSVGVSPSTVNLGGSVTLSFSGRYGNSVAVQFKYGSTLLDSRTATGDSLSYTPPLSWFTSTGATGSMRVDVLATDSTGRTASANFTLVMPGLTITASPSTLYTGNNIAITLGNRLEQAVTLVLRYQQTELYRTTMTYYQTSVFAQESWFETAGVSGNTMQVTAAVSDGLGRTASTSVTVNRPTGSTATPTEPVSVTKSGASQITFKWNYAGDGYQTQQEIQWKTSSGDWQSLGTVASQNAERTISAYTFPQGSIQWRVRVRNSFSILGNWSSAASFNVSYDALSLAASPSTVYDMPAKIGQYNNTVTLGFTNRLGRWLRLQLKYNNTVIREIPNINSDSFAVNMNGFFEEAEATGTSITVRAEVSDDLGRSANVSFTCLKPQGSTATATAPKSTTVDGAGNINFAWTASSDWGLQTGAELQWSTDNAAWTDLTTIDGSDQTWPAPAIQFPAGTIYWRVRVTNSFGLVGNWSSSVSFSVNYSAVSQVVPINSQTSGIFARGADKTFSARFEASGPVYSPFTFASATFKWRAGTSGDWTEVTMTSSDNGVTVSATIPAGTFPQGVMQWMIEATDNTGRTTSTPVYTLTAATSAVDVTPIRPVNTVETNNSEIGFELAFVSLDGSLPKAAEWRWSSDGVEWHSETLTGLDIRDGVLGFTVPAGTFTAGTISWQARAENSADTWGDWSSVVSFKALGAPVVAGVTGDGRPFLTISWQTPAQGEYGQQAYKIEVDGKLYGPYFGADVRSYTLREPLARGSHTIRVAAQNRFGLWSEWTEAQVSVVNIPGSVSFFPAAMAEGPFAHIVMVYAHPSPTITQQPQDYRAETGNARFSFKSRGFASGTKYQPRGSGTTITWFYRTGPGAEWQEYHGPFDGTSATPAASQEIDGYQYRVMLDTDTGRIYSEPATFHYGTPAGPASELKEGTWRSDTGYFMIYRDGVLIGTTYENEFYDYAAIGTHTYRVIQVVRIGQFVEGTPLPDYETVTVTVDAPTIITLDGKKVLPLTLSEDARRSQDIQRAREVAYTQYEGAVFPEAEIGEHESLSVSGDCAWTWEQQAEADAFEVLLGSPVIYKTPGGEMVVGVLDGFTQRDAHFYRTARFTIQQMDWRDYKDEP